MTPLMQQYWEIKSQHEDKVLLFRMGDFFEMFHSDAEVAAPIIGIALTQRNKKDAESPKMCGVPYHSIATPIAKLLAAGKKIALCDQIEDPALAKGLVKRAVTRVLTPGMVYDPDTLDQLSANYLCSYQEGWIAFADITTGEAFMYSYESVGEREEILALLTPTELVLSEREAQLCASAKALVSVLRDAELPSEQSGPSCVVRLLTYIAKLQGEETLRGLQPFEARQRRGQLRVSPTVFRHLEVFQNSRGEKTSTLFETLQRTQTSAGARLLKTWLCSPQLDPAEIQRRQEEIALWLSQVPRLEAFRRLMSQLGDVERRLGKIHSVTFNARDLAAISQSVRIGATLHEQHPTQPRHSSLASSMAVANEIDRALQDELPHGVREGGMIRRGYSPELDELLTLTQDSQALLLELENKERQATGINSLKIRYNNVFGFYIELTKLHASKAPEHYMRKQTLTNAERFTTSELSSLEEKILSARSRRDQLEHEIFLQLREKVIELAPDLMTLCRIWSRWDVLAGLAWLALERKYCRPEFVPEGGDLHLELCRHPVVETSVREGFIPNTVRMGRGECLLLTGPNMAGKSTLMRQVALLVLMAQIGSFVPAEKAKLPLFHQICTRIGASDFLSEGLSTFMVEMSETAEILKSVGAQSLVIMDEIGRGTSTYDGLSLAQAILENLVTQKRPYLLFATHYHELTGLERLHPQIQNAHMSVQEKGGEIRFLHSLVRGSANRSYGIHVAKLAGLPASVNRRAQQILDGFENFSGGGQLSLLEAQPLASFAEPVPSLPPPPDFLEEFKGLDLSQLTPIDALNKLYVWQREVSS